MLLNARLWGGAFCLCLMLTACSPQTAIIAALMPEGTMRTLLGNLEHVSDENRKRVAELEGAGRWHELGGFAEQNLAKDPANADWWLIAGYARSQLGQHRSAAEAYGEAVRLEPDNAAAWHLLAQSHRAAGESRRAVNVLNQARLALRDSALTVFLLGESYSDIGHYTEAAAAYREAIRIEAKFPAAWFGLARAHAKLGRAQEAREARATLEKLDPQLARRLDEAGAGKDTSAR